MQQGRELEGALPFLAMIVNGAIVAALRRRAGLRAVWAFLSAAGVVLAWLSARSWAAALEAGFRIVDYGPADERWAIAAGVLASGAVATHFAIRQGDSVRPEGLEAAIESAAPEAALVSVAGVAAFLAGGMGAGADISRPVVAALALYILVASWILLRRRRRSVA